METDTSSVKFTAEKALRKISEDRPELLSPYYMRIAALLDSSNTFIRWGAIFTIPNLLAVDTEHQWEKLRERYLAFYKTQNIVEFGNAVQGVPKILFSHPEEEKNIVPLLCRIDTHVFLYKGEESPECRNVAAGQIIDCFTVLYASSSYQKEMLAFVKQNTNSSRKQIAHKAKMFLKKFG
jgi:hypothetical protein